MINIEFLGFIATPNDKFLGIASVRVDKRFILRYKLFAKKDGNGYFPTLPKYKITDTSGDRWTDAVMVDSNYEKEEIESVVMKGFREWQKKEKPSVFDTNSKGDDLSDEVPF